MTSRADVVGAAERLVGLVRRTPVATVEGAAFGVRSPVVLKLELLQHTGSFKVRGAFSCLLAARDRGALGTAGAVAASGGNHGLGVAYAAQVLGIRAEIFVPTSAPPVKVRAIGAYDVRVTSGGAFYADAYAAACTRAAETGALLVPAYDHPDVVAGQGTIGLELPSVDTVLVAVGGGGLAAGIALAVDGRARLVGVEPELIPTWHDACRTGHPVDVPVGGIAADSLGARRLGDLPFEVLRRAGAESLLVPDTAILEARRLLWDRFRLATEPGGATAAAALLTGAYRPAAGERLAVVVCGGNTDPADLGADRQMTVPVTSKTS